jgi:YesN/AraC family two-component response regulator
MGCRKHLCRESNNARFLLHTGTSVAMLVVDKEKVQHRVTVSEERMVHCHGTVLIVDDELHIRKILRRMVRQAGYSVTEAASGDEAIGYLDSDGYDIVISDIRMPHMDGMQLLNRIKRHHPETSVVMMTGYAGEFPVSQVMSAGADHYLAKPFGNDDVAATLQDVKEQRENGSSAIN